MFTRWATVVLGQKPVQDPSAFTFLTHWTCSCAACHRAKDFLRKPSLDRPSLTLDRIGAPLRKHVEAYLYGRARLVATATMIRSSPQGLEVCGSRYHHSTLRSNAPVDILHKHHKSAARMGSQSEERSSNAPGYQHGRERIETRFRSAIPDLDAGVGDRWSQQNERGDFARQCTANDRDRATNSWRTLCETQEST